MPMSPFSRSMSTRNGDKVPNTLQNIRSMHKAVRMLEEQRIERDNIKIAKKIFMMEPAFKVSDLRQEFNLHQQFSANANKIKREILPPIMSPRHIVKPEKKHSAVKKKKLSLE